MLFQKQLFQKQFFKIDKDTIFSVFLNENQYKDIDKLQSIISFKIY